MSFKILLLAFCILSTLGLFIWLGLVARQVNVSKGIDKISIPTMWIGGIGVLISIIIMWGGYILFITQ